MRTVVLLVAVICAVVGRSADGARAGESLEARIARLEMQLRLSKAERKVNRK